MKKLIFILLFFVSFFVQGQRKDSLSNFSISVSAGTSFPIGKFKSKFVSYNSSVGPWLNPIPLGNEYNCGYALTGAIYDISADYRIKNSHFGITSLLGYGDNSFDIKQFLSNMDQIIYDGSHTSYSINYQGNAKSPYYEYSVLAGGFFTTSLGKVSFNIKILGGMAICVSPEVLYNNNLRSGYFTDITYKSSTANSMDINFGIGTSYSITHGIFLTMQGGLMYTVPTFKIKGYEVDYNPTYIYNQQAKFNVSSTISLLSATLGIGYRIGK